MDRPIYYHRTIVASDPLDISVSQSKLRLLIGSTRVSYNIEALGDRLSHGDSRAAVVIQLSPLIVAAYSGDMDCIAPLRFPDDLVGRYRLKERSRLITTNTYESRGNLQVVPDLKPGQSDTTDFRNIRPLIADFLSDDMEVIEARKKEISEAEWERAEELGWAWLADPARLTPRDGDPFRSRLPVIPGVRWNGPKPERKDPESEGFYLRLAGAAGLALLTVVLALFDGGGVFAFMAGMWFVIVFPWRVGSRPRWGEPTVVTKRPGFRLRVYKGWSTAGQQYENRDNLSPAQELRVSGTNFLLCLILSEGCALTLPASVREDLELLAQQRRKRLVQAWETSGTLAGIPCVSGVGRLSDFEDSPWEIRAWAAWRDHHMITARLLIGPGTPVASVERCLKTLELT